MMKAREREFFFIALIAILGLAVRLSVPLAATFPLNDGGLFYRMVIDLQHNGFVLPATTTYNFADLPFAYPPFAFYLYGALNSSGIQLLSLMQFLPAIVSACSVPVFYFLAKAMLGDREQALLASVALALVPRAFDWLIMGGGMTRSLGFLFAILAIHQIFLLFTQPASIHLVLSVVLSGLVVLTHPEAAVHTAIAAVFIYAWKDRSLKGLARAVLVTVGALVISAPWWVNIIAQHGGAPFQAAADAANRNSIAVLVRVFALIKFQFTDEPFLPVISALGLLGLFTLLARRKPALPIWFVLMGLAEPRGGSLYMMLPLAMFAGVTFTEIVQPVLKPQDGNSRPWVWNTFIGFFLLYGLISASVTASNINRDLTLTREDLNAFSWVKENTPQESRFILVTQALPLNDSTSEWFPVLAERASLATLFGYEWVDDGNFNARAENYTSLQACASKDIICLESWAQGKNFSHILIRTNPRNTSGAALLVFQLKSSDQYKTIYENGGITIFEEKP